MIIRELKHGSSWATNGNRNLNVSLLTPFDAIISLLEDIQHIGFPHGSHVKQLEIK